MSYARIRALAWCVLAMSASACIRSVSPLKGEVVPTSLPKLELPTKHLQITFSWVYGDDSFSANGDGAIRIAPPDSARLDFFLRNGSAGGYAILNGDSLHLPGPLIAEKFMPPATMLWAALNRLALPQMRDTVARRNGDTVTADIGNLRGGDARSAEGRAWRVTLTDKQIVRVDRIENKRFIESVVRVKSALGDTIRYYHEHAHRRLTIVFNDTLWVEGEGFDAAIWRR